MLGLLLRLGISVCLAYCSQHGIGRIRITKRWTVDVPLVIMIVILSLFCGLRTAFNDTEVYIRGFLNAPTLSEYLAEGINLFENPLYYGIQSFFRHWITDNYHIYLLVTAFFTISSFVRFIKTYSTNFVFSIVLFFTIGLYLSNFAAMKQSIAMAILMYAISALIEKKTGRFYLLVFIAMLIHTYAIMFAILPLFTQKPWTPITYLAIAAIIFVLFTFESTISEFLEYAEDLGKEINETEVFETQSISLFRLAVFAVPPLFSFIFQKRLNSVYGRTQCIAINMSILSFLVMCLGLASAGNLFGRSAVYFEIGTIIALPLIVQKLFTKQSAKIVSYIAGVCYIAFFVYDIQSFDAGYRAITILQFLSLL